MVAVRQLIRHLNPLDDVVLLDEARAKARPKKLLAESPIPSRYFVKHGIRGGVTGAAITAIAGYVLTNDIYLSTVIGVMGGGLGVVIDTSQLALRLGKEEERQHTDLKEAGWYDGETKDQKPN